MKIVEQTDNTVTVEMSHTDLVLLASYVSSHATDLRYGREPMTGEPPLFQRSSDEQRKNVETQGRKLLELAKELP